MTLNSSRDDVEPNDGRSDRDSALDPEGPDGEQVLDVSDAEHHPYRGEVLGGAAASVCSGVKPDPLRYAYYQPAIRILIVFGLIVGLLAFGAFSAGWALHLPGGGRWPGLAAVAFYGIGLMLGFIGLLNLLLLVMGYQAAARYFKNALLTPGVVVESKPLTVVVLAPLGNGSGPEYHGIQRLDFRTLPYHGRTTGTRVPCVSAFVPGVGLDRWVSFLPEPVSWGTGRRADVDQCFERLGTRDFDRLDACVKRGLVPNDTDELILLDGDDRQLARLSIRELKEKYPAEAPASS